MRQNRDTSIGLIFGHEGGYVNRPETDNGGPTNMGITLRTLSAWKGFQATIAMLRNLTKAEAWEIYAKNYWEPIRADELPSGLDYAVMDSCVTSGPSRAIKILQTTLAKAGVKNVDGSKLGIDGSIGANTLAGIRAFPGGLERLIRAYCDERVAWMKTLGGPKGWASNGRGWHIRVTGIDPNGKWKPVPGVVGNALRMAASPAMIERMVTDPNPVDQIPVDLAKAATTKTADAVTSITTILQQKESIVGILASVGAVVTAVAQNNVLAYTTAGCMAVGLLGAGYYFIRRVRAENK